MSQEGMCSFDGRPHRYGTVGGTSQEVCSGCGQEKPKAQGDLSEFLGSLLIDARLFGKRVEEAAREASDKVMVLIQEAMDAPGPSAPTPSPVEDLVKGLRKTVKNDDTELVDANIIRLLLDRYDTAQGS